MSEKYDESKEKETFNLQIHEKEVSLCNYCYVALLQLSFCRACMALVYSQILAIKQRSTWCKPRPSVFWKSAIDGVFGGYWFRDNLCMHKDTFFMICDELKPHLSKKVTRLRRPISVDECVAVTLWRLATNVEYRTIACLFGLGTSTVGKIVLETCKVIVKVLLPKFVKFPS